MASDMYRNFAFEVYADSAPENWIERLRALHIPLFVSPLHSKDLDFHGMGYSGNEYLTDVIFDAKGEVVGFRNGERKILYKKAHYHVFVVLEGKVTEKRIHKIFDDFAANKYIEIVSCRGGYARYLCHLDEHCRVYFDKDDVQEVQFKYLYDVYRVISMSGADYFDAIADTRTDDMYDAQIHEFIQSTNCTNFYVLSNYFRRNDANVSRYIRHNTTYVRALLEGKYKTLHPDTEEKNS